MSAYMLSTKKQNIDILVEQGCSRIVRFAAENLEKALNDGGLIKATLNGETAQQKIIIKENSALPEKHYRISVENDSVLIEGTSAAALAAGVNRLTEGYKKAQRENKEFEIVCTCELFIPTGTDYKLVWCDEFEGDEIDRGLWVDQGPRMDKVSCLNTPYHIMRSANSEVRDGKAVIYSRRDPETSEFYTGQISTNGTHRFLYGCIEFYAKLAVLPGANAIWFVSEYPDDGNGNPEIDLLEDFGIFDGFAANIHRWGNCVNAKTGEKHRHTSLDGGVFAKAKHYNCPKDIATLRGEWHLYSLQWDRNVMNFCVDGEVFFSYNISTAHDDFGTAAFHRPLYSIISATLGAPGYCADWKEGDPDRIEIEVDYVRLYQRDCDGGISTETKIK